METQYSQVLTLPYQNELNNSWLNCALRCHGGGETCASLTGDWRWRVHTGSDSNYNSPYLYEVHTFLFYCRLGSSCKRAVLLKSVTWTCTIWLFSIKWTIDCEKTYFIIFLNSDSDCFIRSLLRTERGGAKAGAQARWPPLLRGKTKPLCCIILLILLMKSFIICTLKRKCLSTWMCAFYVCKKTLTWLVKNPDRISVFERSRLSTNWIGTLAGCSSYSRYKQG